jgi:hypothetical protein
MSHLNYFIPYNSKEAHHEDQLSRAFLVVLRYIPMARAIFVEMIRRKQADKPLLPSISEPDFYIEDGDYRTQVTEIEKDTGYLLSVFITDEKIDATIPVSNRNQAARYDGVIYAPNWTIIIENKPYDNYWEKQLSPNLKEKQDIQIIPTAINLTWKDIIERLASLIIHDQVNGAEKYVLQDFFGLIDIHFSHLNPYNRFSICKKNIGLLERKCILILKEIGEVFPHKGGKYYLGCEGGIAQEIVMYPEKTDNEISIYLYLYPGDTQFQAKRFYAEVKREEFLSLAEKGWAINPHLHFFHIQKHLHWAKTEISYDEYFDYWKNNQDKIRQYKRNELTTVFKSLLDNKLICQGDIKELQSHFLDKDRQFMNICPGFKIYYKWSLQDAIKLDEKKRFTDEVKDKIKQSMSSWGQKL